MGGLIRNDSVTFSKECDTMTNTINKITTDPSNINYYFVPSIAIPAITQFNHILLPDNYTNPIPPGLNAAQRKQFIDQQVASIANNAGSIHFNKASQIEYGKRYFYVFNGSINFT